MPAGAGQSRARRLLHLVGDDVAPYDGNRRIAGDYISGAYSNVPLIDQVPRSIVSFLNRCGPQVAGRMTVGAAGWAMLATFGKCRKPPGKRLRCTVDDVIRNRRAQKTNKRAIEVQREQSQSGQEDTSRIGDERGGSMSLWRRAI